MSNAAISIENLAYKYERGSLALQNINIEIKEREFVGIIGQNGAGKSTLLKNITGLLKPTEGRILVNGQDTKDKHVSDLAMEIGFVLQNPDRQLFADTVYQEVAFGPRNMELSQAEIDSRVEYALDAVGLSSMKEAYPPALSKGDRAKVVIASVLAMGPKIIILDEPTSGQDFRGCYQIMDIAKEFNRRGHTLVVVTHHMTLVAEYTARTIVMMNGGILMDADTREVFSHPEKLKQTHIMPPQITQVANELRSQLGIEQTMLNVSEFGQELLKLKERKVSASHAG